jgi:hypothetical protein
MNRPSGQLRTEARPLMAARGLWKTSELVPLLAGEGVVLSPAQVYRLVAKTPERLSLATPGGAVPDPLLLAERPDRDRRARADRPRPQPGGQGTATAGRGGDVTYDYVRRLQRCVRCGHELRFGIASPEGFVCIGCIDRATKLRGRCPGCGDERLLVGRDPAGAPICRDCAGIATCFVCRHCGKEDEAWYSHTCLACSLSIRLRRVLGDGGGVPAALEPLYRRLVAMEHPIAALTWLNKPAVRQRLQALAGGQVPLTHDGLDQLEGAQGKEFLRELLVEVGVPAPRDKYLAAFRAWVPKRLAAIPEPDINREIRLFIAWREERELAVRAESGRLDAGRVNRARDAIDSGVSFLRLLAGRGRCLGEAGQEDLDAFFATARRPFGATDYLVFAIGHRRCRRLELPRRPRQCSHGTPLPALAPIVATLLEDEALELADRVAGLLVLLFAQSFTRFAGLRLGALTCSDGEVAVNLGAHPVPLPAAVASIFSRYLERRVNTGTTNTATDFLFPGCRPGQHVTAFQLTKRMNALGITKAERQGALTHLVNEAPAAVVAKATGYSLGSTPLPDRCCSDRTGPTTPPSSRPPRDERRRRRQSLLAAKRRMFAITRAKDYASPPLNENERAPFRDTRALTSPRRPDTPSLKRVVCQCRPMASTDICNVGRHVADG